MSRVRKPGNKFMNTNKYPSSEIEVIDKYELPSDESIQERALAELVCETCLYASQCYGEPCLAPDGYREERIQWLKQMAKDVG